MRILYRIVFLLSLTLSLQAQASLDFNFFPKVYHKLIYEDEYTFETHEEYEYPQCKKYNAEDEQEYIVTCETGQEEAHPVPPFEKTNLNAIGKPGGILLKEQLKDHMLKKLREYVLKELASKTEKHLDLRDCLIHHMNQPAVVTKTCRDKVQQLRTMTRNGLPLMRQHMGLMKAPYRPIIVRDNMPAESYKYKKQISHPGTDKEITPIDQKEAKAIMDLYDEEEAIDRKHFMQGLQQKYDCAVKDENGKYQYKDHNCMLLHRRRLGAHLSQQRKKHNKEHEDNYFSLIAQAPHLAFINTNKLPKNDRGVDVQIIKAYDTMKNNALDEYEKWKGKSLEDFNAFFRYPHIIQNFLKQYPRVFSQATCDILQDFHDEYGPGGTEELTETIGVAAFALVGGGVCAFTAGLGCALGVAIATEGYVLTTSQIELGQTQSLYGSGLGDYSAIKQARDNRNLNLLLAPLSFVGLHGGKVGASALKGMGQTGKRNLIGNYLNFKPTDLEQNKAWIKLAKENGADLYLDVENAALKRLNDTIGDKNIVTSITNLHKEILFKELDELMQKYPGVEVLKYSDFKSSRFAFKGEIPKAMEKDLKKMFEKVNQDFVTKLEDISGLGIPERENPLAWFNGGIGKSADQAGLATRQARVLRKGNATNFVNIKTIKAVLRENMDIIEHDRANLAIAFKKAGAAKYLDSSSGVPIPDVEVFEVLRKAKDIEGKELSDLLKKRFGFELPVKEVDRLKKYAHDVDQFSPGIWIEERVVANLDAAEMGGFSVDFKGMGAKNIAQVAKDLAASGKDVDKAIKTIRSGEEVVTKEFDKAKTTYDDLVGNTLKELDVPITTKCSGDDCVSIPTGILPPVAKEKMVQAIAKTDNPSGYRLSFIPPGVRQEVRTELAVHGELVEKQIRKGLTGFGDNMLPPEVLNKVTIALDMPSTFGKGKMKVIIKGADGVTLSDADKTLIRDYLPDAVKKVNKGISEETGKSVKYGAGEIQFLP